MNADRIEILEILCAEAYQVIGVLANDLGRFDDEDVIQVLDNLSELGIVHETAPFEATKFDPRVPVVGNRGGAQVVLMRDALGSIRAVETQLGIAKSDNETLTDALRSCVLLFTEAIPKFNWGASFLDAKAIALLNTVPGEAAYALENYGTKERDSGLKAIEGHTG